VYLQGAEQPPLLGRRVLEQGERLVRVAGQDRPVEAQAPAVLHDQQDVIGAPADRADGRVQHDPVPARLGQRRHVGPRPALHEGGA
jgi:hypothetical protein